MLERPKQKMIATMRTGEDSGAVTATYSANQDEQKKQFSREEGKKIIERLYPNGSWKKKL